MAAAHDLHESFVHLGLGATAEPQPAFTGYEWYEDYIARTAADGAEGRLVSLYRFSQSWDSWEMHPAGAELVVCISGNIILIQELPSGSEARIALGPGQYAVNPAGVWHTADVEGEAQALFITAGLDTEHRLR
jgi:quercetin dioxygenase-like cupin family protein